MDFQQQLKVLSKLAKQQAEQRAAAEREAAARAAAREPDFAALMRDVVPLKDNGRYYPPPDRRPIKPRIQTDETASGSQFYVGTDNGDELPATFSKNGRGINDIKRLQAGHWPVVADVDLHGYTQEAAQQVLNEFIEFVQKRGVCGEIIHGSGLGSRGYTPVLRSLVRRWLMQHPDVLAYAPPQVGNDGAVRILLKRVRRPDLWAETA